MKLRFTKNVMLFFSCLCVVLLIGPVEQFSRNKLSVEGRHDPLPEAAADLFSLEFKNLASDLSFFDAITFVGEKDVKRRKPREWEWFYLTVNVSSHLNPYNVDPYYLGETMLTWEAGMYDRANHLLERSLTYREKEWVFPFFIGFNYFYFLKDSNRGAEYVDMAVKKPGAPKTVLTTLASRLYYRSGRTEVGLVLLRDARDHAAGEDEKRLYERRIKAMEGVHAVETAATKYEKIYLRRPRTVMALVKAGLLSEFPKDPYGGTYFIDELGNVTSTSDFK